MMSVSPEPADHPPVLDYVGSADTRVAPAARLTGIVALVVLVCVGTGVVLIAYEAIDAFRAARLTSHRSLDRTLVILTRPRTFQRPEFAGRWWLTFALTACAAWSAAMLWTAVAAQRVLRTGHWALPSLRGRTWVAAVVAVLSAATLLAYGAHVRRVFRDWDILGDFLYRDTGLLTLLTTVGAGACCVLAAWIEHRNRRINSPAPHSNP